jgi:hypothetical protein
VWTPAGRKELKVSDTREGSTQERTFELKLYLSGSVLGEQEKMVGQRNGTA